MSDSKAKFVAAFLMASCAISAQAQGVLTAVPQGWLITAAEAIEFKGEDGFNEPPALRPRAVVPLIDILKPEPVSDLKVKAPFAIAVQFKSQADAPIDPGTFKVMYGTFKVDITSRITKYVKVTKEGFSLENAQIPTGKHRLTMQVQDEKQRVAERELRLEVE
ncbi:hypothetical protein [Rhodoferax sp.]|uniref:hypothetical protein n=1 Tax=Rhodoferax sp. TaxID=50421 RepID=UPI001EC03743|nr:hypothetical protein [Rhodoferax sp.]MBT9505217.1 hypothetical protein [Rhodoferax sp.]